MKEKTIRETIKHCINETQEGIIPIPFVYMLRSFALLLYLDACQRKEKETDKDIISMIADGGIFEPDNLNQFMQLQKFLKWWLSKPRHAFCKSENDDGGLDFGDNISLVNAWNQYVKECDDL